MAENDNRRTIPSSRFRTNRASGFGSRNLSTTGNVAPSPAAPTPRVSQVATPRRRTPSEEESGADFGRVSGAGLRTPVAFDQGDTGQGGVRTRGNVGGTGLGPIGRAAVSVIGSAFGPVGLAGSQIINAFDRRAAAERADLPPSTPQSGFRSTGEQSSSPEQDAPSGNPAQPFQSIGPGGPTAPPSAGDRGSDAQNDFGGGVTPGAENPFNSIGPGGGFGFARGGMKNSTQAYASGGSPLPTDAHPAIAPAGAPVGGTAAGTPLPHAQSGAGLVQGPGDGNDDLVPDRISAGEYVIPPDVVAELGDGNTQSGAQLLDQVIAVVRDMASQRLANTPPPIGAEERAALPPPAAPANPLQRPLPVAG